MMIIDPYRGGVTGPATIEFVAVYTTTFSGASNEIQTASGVDFGAEAPGRAMFAAINFGRASPQANLLSVTIGGEAADVIMLSPATSEDVGGVLYDVALVAAFLPAGSSGDIVATFNVAAGTTIAVYRATNIGSLTPKHTASSSGDGSISVSINEVASGIVVAAGSSAFRFDPFTYSHVPLLYTDDNRYTGGALETSSAASGQTITMTAPYILVGSPNLALIAASFR